MPRARARRRGLMLAAALAVSLGVSACGGATSSTSVRSGPLTVAVFVPFEGAEAVIGPEVEAECYAASTAFNTAGGVLGHKVQCTPYDSTSDPADAVPVATRLLATAKNLVLVDGPGSEEPAVEPLLNNAKVIHLGWNGLPFYDHQSSPYFYRAFPSDSLAGNADALYLVKQGYAHAAGVFDNSEGAQAQVPSLLKTYAKLGHKLAINLQLAPNSTYQSEAHQLVGTHPDAIMSELDTPQEVEAWYSALAQLSHGQLPPLIPTASEVNSTNNWIQLVKHALGTDPIGRIVQISPGGPLGGPGYDAFRQALLSAPESISNRQQFLGKTWINQGYDAIIVDGLAIDEAKTTDSAQVAPLISEIANGTPGAVTVHTYAEGKQAIAAGHRVHYVGAGGVMVFNKWHNIVTPFEIFRYEGSKGWVVQKGQTITPQALAQTMK